MRLVRVLHPDVTYTHQDADPIDQQEVDSDTDTDASEASKASGTPGKWMAWLGLGLSRSLLQHLSAGSLSLSSGSAVDFPEVGYIELAPDGITNHLAAKYRESLAVVAASRSVALEAEPRAAETFLDWRQRAKCT